MASQCSQVLERFCFTLLCLVLTNLNLNFSASQVFRKKLVLTHRLWSTLQIAERTKGRPVLVLPVSLDLSLHVRDMGVQPPWLG